MRGRLRARLLVAIWALVSLSVALALALFGRVERGGTLVVVSVVAGALVAFAASQLAMSWLDDAVRPLTERARRMHGGDLAVRARIGRDEDVGQLGAAFDQLAGSLSETVSELRTERDLVSRILNGMGEGVLLLDKDGTVALMNPALREMLLLRADAVGQPLLEVVRHAELKELLDRARTKQATTSGEVELGGLKPRRLLVRATSFKEQGGGGLLAVFFDVTDIRRLESLRRDFVANVSHELRTPVTAILSASETLEIALAKDPEGAKRFLQIIDRNATRLQRLIEDLLDLSRIESRELRLRPERFPFEPFATHLLGLFRDRADKKRIVLKLDVQKGLEADADRRALEQVLTNLVDNAVKYCQEGATVTLHAESTASGIRARVADDGPGIDEKHLPRLFERFYRVDAGRSREMGGTGLGLSIVKHLVESMGGTIEVTSQVGKGTTFEIRIPHASSRVQGRASSEDLGPGLVAVAALAMLAMHGVACTRPAPTDASPRILVGAGATLPYPLYSRWAADYAKVEPSVRVNYQSTGSAAGVRGVSDGVVDFGATDDPASASPKLVRIPMTIGAIVLAYNLPGAGALRLTPELVADVFLGTITRWDDERIHAVNPDRQLPAQPIVVVHRAEGSGTSAAFTTYLARTSEPWKAKVGASATPRFPVGIGAKGNEGVTALVKTTPYAVGYVELAYAKQAGLPMALVKNRAGRFIAPSVEAVDRAARSADDATLVDAKDEGAYPIAAVSYAIVPREGKDKATNESLARFFTWALHDGQKLAPSLDYAALPPELVAQGERAVAELR